MQLQDILIQAKRTELSDKELLAVLNKACPQLKYIARPETEKWCGWTDVSQENIRRYLLQVKSYDAVDISNIRRELNGTGIGTRE